MTNEEFNQRIIDHNKTLSELTDLSQSLTPIIVDALDGYATLDQAKQSIKDILKQIESKLEELK